MFQKRFVSKYDTNLFSLSDPVEIGRQAAVLPPAGLLRQQLRPVQLVQGPLDGGAG